MVPDAWAKVRRWGRRTHCLWRRPWCWHRERATPLADAASIPPGRASVGRPVTRLDGTGQGASRRVGAHLRGGVPQYCFELLDERRALLLPLGGLAALLRLVHQLPQGRLELERCVLVGLDEFVYLLLHLGGE